MRLRFEGTATLLKIPQFTAPSALCKICQTPAVRMTWSLHIPLTFHEFIGSHWISYDFLWFQMISCHMTYDFLWILRNPPKNGCSSLTTPGAVMTTPFTTPGRTVACGNGPYERRVESSSGKTLPGRVPGPEVLDLNTPEPSKMDELTSWEKSLFFRKIRKKVEEVYIDGFHEWPSVNWLFSCIVTNGPNRNIELRTATAIGSCAWIGCPGVTKLGPQSSVFWLNQPGNDQPGNGHWVHSCHCNEIQRKVCTTLCRRNKAWMRDLEQWFQWFACLISPNQTCLWILWEL